jgi:DNA-binding NtrC family response regulator
MKTNSTSANVDPETHLCCPQCGHRLTVRSFRRSVQLAKGASALAKSDLPVLLLNGHGSDKQLFSRMIHDNSFKSAGPFCVFDCADNTEQMQEIELFGCPADSFESFSPARPGLIHTAVNGTLFIDKVERLTMTAQTKLYRFLQTGSYTAAGSWRVRYAQVRVIVASDVDLPKAVQRGVFLRDLYYRMTTAVIRVPSLWPSAPLTLQLN